MRWIKLIIVLSPLINMMEIQIVALVMEIVLSHGLFVRLPIQEQHTKAFQLISLAI